MKEKEYEFSKARYGDKIPKIYILKESQLDDKHEFLLLGNIINEFDKLPEKVKNEFVKYIEKLYET